MRERQENLKFISNPVQAELLPKNIFKKDGMEVVMNKRRILYSLYLFFIVLYSSGCAGINDYYVSKLDNPSKNSKSWTNGVVVLELKDIRLCLQLDNQYPFREGGELILPIPIMGRPREVNDKYTGESFVIELAMKSYSEDFTFNPIEVYLRLETGENIKADKYYKPDFDFSAPNPNYGIEHGSIVPLRYNFKGMKQKFYKNDNQSFECPKHKWIGFYIFFNAPRPNPGTPFSIEIRGLKRAGENVPVEEIRFKDKKIFRDMEQWS